MDFFLRPFRGENLPEPRCGPRVLDFIQAHPHRLDLEIGCGAGMHAIGYAGANPARGLIAIERTKNKFAAFESRLKNHPLMPNLLPIYDDALLVVAKLIPDLKLQNVFMLYPNPYPKSSQANKRFHRMPFIRCLHQKMSSGANLHLATNENFYQEEAISWLEELGLFELIQKKQFTQLDIGGVDLLKARTHFEKKYLKSGQTVYDLVFQKI